MSNTEIEDLRRLGLTEYALGDKECVRITVQLRDRRADQPAEDWRHHVDDWRARIEKIMSDLGGEVVPGSFSWTGQMLEALVPTTALGSAREDAAAAAGRVDLVTPRAPNR